MAKRLIRSFNDALTINSRGRFRDKVDAELLRVIEALEAHPDDRAKAQLTVVFDMTYLNGRLDIKPSVRAKLPEDKGFPATPFWIVDGALSLEHPSQTDMFDGPRDAESRSAAKA